MTIPVPVIDANGVTIPTYPDIYDGILDEVKAIYGSDIYVDPDSQDGQMLSIFARAMKAMADAVGVAYNAFSPTYAQGAGLSTVIKINGLSRLVASYSTVVVRISGVVGTIINFGQVGDENTNSRWLLPGIVQIPVAGFIDVTATSADPGDITALAGSITKILTPTRNWQSALSLTDADPGDPIETDAALRQRQAKSTSLPAQTVRGATEAAIANLPTVTRVRVYENDTDAVNADGLPVHSISPVVEGGDIQSIANTIALKKTPGTGTYGTTAQNTVDRRGFPLVVHFFVLATKGFFVLAKLVALDGYLSTTGSFIQASVITALNTLNIGDDSLLNKLWSPVNLTGDAAIAATGMQQSQLDLLGVTYNVTDIYQGDAGMVTVGAHVAGNNTFIVTDPTNYAIGKLVALQLDAGYLYTVVTNLVGSTVTTANAVPAGHTSPIGAHLYARTDIIVPFNKAAISVLADVIVDIP